MNIKELNAKLTELRDLIATDFDKLNPGIRGVFEGKVQQAMIDIVGVKAELKSLVAKNAEIVLIDGPEAELAEALGGIKLSGIINIDAQGAFKQASERLLPYTGEISTITSDAYTTMLGFIDSISKDTGIKPPRLLSYREGTSDKSLEQNLRDMVREDFGGAGLEPAYVLMELTNIAVNSGISDLPVFAVVYNTQGATEQDYSGVFPGAVSSFTFKTGSEQEVKKMIETVKEKLVSQGKIKVKSSKKTKTNTETQE